MIRLENVSFSYGRQMFMRDLNCEMADGRITAIIGPNGSGKSTLLRLCAGLLKPTAGSIYVANRSISDYKPREFARELAFMPQARPTPMLTVRSLVENGRFPYLGVSRKPGKADIAAVEQALEAVGLTEIADREVRTLSGGERQKAYLGMLIAQGAQHLLLDEPTTFLDIGHQLELMELLAVLRRAGKCIVMVLHDIDMAIEHCDEVIVMAHGGIIHRCAAHMLIGSGAVEEAYGVRAVQNTGVRFERI